MSCRVFNRGIEDAVIYSLIKLSNEWGFDRIESKLIESKKNFYCRPVFSDRNFSAEDINSFETLNSLDLGKNYQKLLGEYERRLNIKVSF